MSHGILVSTSAGNDGPQRWTLSNLAPWMITSGAGTIDRDFPSYVTLGNGETFKGVESLYKGKPLSDGFIPIVYAEDEFDSLEGFRENSDLQSGKELVTDSDFMPSVAVSLKTGNKIKGCLNSVSNPTTNIVLKGTKLGVQPSPIVAAFSSRRATVITPEIVKPNVLAPGVNILAGWSGAIGPTKLDQDKRRVSFNIISGTSLACPHVTGLAALVKSVHPEWSPAAIKSAFMTTAYSTYKNGETIQDVVTGSPVTPFDYGCGHVDPVAALDPGLVYDITVEDYIRFLCASNYTKKQIKTVTKRDFNCNYAERKYSAGDLNYPSIAVPLKHGGDNGSTTVDSVNISVKPESLTFNEANERLTYTVTFTAGSMPKGTARFARLEWSDGKILLEVQ
ncbi:Peptidase S8, subtilisin-related [Parasponia andersonii]|uniref:Peptidase S8, subtilisin-related n=1 Tax=Parasponia andersonii TaxID=3476 RepID=A0A2P5BZR9_PARAD|nr:Peptidase S8, subtilisin-related [Parasponia andersonii]